ncbi:MAG: hypothetical protein KGJ13_06110 [Patescibacteria group bacterium]|nr:hypothetical protein [Patescibacteria group bacterium]
MRLFKANLALLLALIAAGPLTGQVRPRQGIRIVRTLPAPPQPQVKLYGAAGSTTYTYFVTAVQAGFESAAGSAAINNAPASPSSGDAVGIFWRPEGAAASYRVYKVTGTTEPTGGSTLLCTTTASYCYDTGQALSAGFPPQTAPAVSSDLSSTATPPDSGAQVYNVKAYGARGDDSSDDEPAFAAAVAAMPGCSQGGSNFTHCGTVFIPPGVYYFAENLLIDSPFVTVEGGGMGAVTIDSHVPANSCTVTFHPAIFNTGYNTAAGGVFNVYVDGTNTGSGSNGICVHDMVGFQSNAFIENFTSGTGLWDEADTGWNERWNLGLTLANNHISWLINNQHTGAAAATFGYGNFIVKINPNAGQYGIYFDDANASPDVLDNATGNIIENVTDAGTCVQFGESVHTFKFNGSFHCEQSSGTGGVGIGGAASSAYFDRLNLGGLSTNISVALVAAKQANFLETFANLPAASASNIGWTAAISDSNTATFGATAAGGGSNHVRVFSDGTHWLVY